MEQSAAEAKCPPRFPHPVRKGPYVSAGLCYTKEEYANAGSGTVGSWCARTPEKNSSIQQQIRGGEGSNCKDVGATEHKPRMIFEIMSREHK